VASAQTLVSEPDVAVVSSKGQVVIPQPLRKRFGIKPKSKLVVYGYDDAIIMKKLNVPDVSRELQALYKRVDKKIAEYGEMTDSEIAQIIEQHRSARRKRR